MNRLTCETARRQKYTAEDKIRDIFGKAVRPACDAVWLDAAKTRALGVAGLIWYMPVCGEIINAPAFRDLLRSQTGSVLVVMDEKTHGSVETIVTENGEMRRSGEDDESAGSYGEAAAAVEAAVRRLTLSPGEFNEKGELILDLKGQQVGLHYPVNLLLGDRSRFEFPLVTTPKSTVDALGRGSFRAAGGEQVLATRYTLHPEENGEPANRQFYLFEDGKQIFLSSDVSVNVKEAKCRHSQNRTVITYTTEDGLKITRTIFILPQEEGMPDAVEVQRIVITNLSGRPRKLRLVATGVFGMQGPATIAQDVVYANLVAETEIMYDGGKPAVLALNSKPAADRLKKRFVMLLADGKGMDEFCNSLSEFTGSGSLERPEHGAWLTNTLQRKMTSFFALAKTLDLQDDASAAVDIFAGMCDAEHGVTTDAGRAIDGLYEKYSDPSALDEVIAGMVRNWEKYSSYLIPETDDAMFNAYVRSDLPFQVLYQTFVSRSFAWTQKAYRETGFREIQDIYASMYYMSANGDNDLIRRLIGNWVCNVWEMGYANHNFTFAGKEPGDCSDDQLWLLQAVYRYVKLTGDTGFLDMEFGIAGTDRKRSLRDTIKAILTYSGKISVGRHGLPLLDKADWNDTLRLDHGVMHGPAKEKLYLEQLRRTGAKYGVPLENDQSESVMNAFLLIIAADEAAELADMTGDKELGDLARCISRDVLESCRKNAWKGGYYARCLINDDRGFEYIGSEGDGLSGDPDVPGSYFLNSYSWALLSGAADESQIRSMLERVNRYLKTDAGLKLCTLIAFERLGIEPGTAYYFPGDRENCGVFKHAAMMAATASLKAAREVSDITLAEELRELAFFMIDKTLPYKAMDDPFVNKGNPRFCTQYNNSETGENIGPMLSGTASWLTLGIYEYFGLDVRKDEIEFRPVLRPGEDTLRYTVGLGDAVLHVTVSGRDGNFRADSGTVYSASRRDSDTRISFDAVMKRPDEGEWDIGIML